MSHKRIPSPRQRHEADGFQMPQPTWPFGKEETISGGLKPNHGYGNGRLYDDEGAETAYNIVEQ